MTPARPGQPRVRPLRFGPLRLHQRLDAGATAEVWSATGIGRKRCAVKRLVLPFAADPLFRARFAQEIEVLRHCRGSGLPRLLGSGEAEGLPWLAMPLLGQTSLHALLQTEGIRAQPWWPDAALLLLADVATALGRLHRAGLIHGDVTARNVRVGQNGRAALVDLGLTVAVQQDGWSAPQPAVGTPSYRPGGVVLAGRWSAQLDAYALGCLALRCLQAPVAQNARPDEATLRAAGWQPGPAHLLAQAWQGQPEGGRLARRLRSFVVVRHAAAVRVKLGVATGFAPQPGPLVADAAELRGEAVTSLSADPDATAVGELLPEV